MNKKHLYWGFGLGLLTALYFVNSERWVGYAYPNKNDLSKVIELGEFKSEEECNAAAIKTLRAVSSIGSGDYECHKN